MCFTHVSDAAGGIVECLENKNSDNTDFNISSSEKVKIIDLAKKIWNVSGRHEKFRVEMISGDSHQKKVSDIRVPDVSKAKKLLNWTAKVKLEDGLKRTVIFFKNNF
jgi:nucleoside-diphosphate-sugar epimerase